MFLRNSAVIALLHRGAHAARGDPGGVRDQPAGVLRPAQVSALFLAVYLFPAILLAIPLFVFFTALGLRGLAARADAGLRAQTVPMTIYMLRNYFDTVPGSLEEAAAIDGADPAARSSARSACRWRCRRSWRPGCSCS